MDNISPIGDVQDFNKGFDTYNNNPNQNKKTEEIVEDDDEIDLLSQDHSMTISDKKIPSPKEVTITKKSSLEINTNIKNEVLD